MNSNSKDSTEKILRLMKILPIVLVITLIVLVVLNYDKITVENIIKFTPKNPLLAGLSILVLFALKSINVVFPIGVLYLSSGKLFTTLTAFLINISGLIITLMIPYFIGRKYGENLIDHFIEKYPEINRVNNFKSENEWFFVIIVRFLKFIPGDISSILLGSMEIKPFNYLLFSLLVRAPALFTLTFIGNSIQTQNKTGFIISTIASGIIAIVSSIIFYNIKKREQTE